MARCPGEHHPEDAEPWPETAQNEEEVQRFVRAMKTMMPIRHPNIVE